MNFTYCFQLTQLSPSISAMAYGGLVIPGGRGWDSLMWVPPPPFSIFFLPPISDIYKIYIWLVDARGCHIRTPPPFFFSRPTSNASLHVFFCSVPNIYCSMVSKLSQAQRHKNRTRMNGQHAPVLSHVLMTQTGLGKAGRENSASYFASAGSVVE